MIYTVIHVSRVCRNSSFVTDAFRCESGVINLPWMSGGARKSRAGCEKLQKLALCFREIKATYNASRRNVNGKPSLLQ